MKEPSNLRFGNLEATDEEIVEVTKRRPMSITLSGHSWWLQYGNEPGVSNISLGQSNS